MELILESKWRMVESHNASYDFENIYNGYRIVLTHKQVSRVLNGEDTISHIIARRLTNERRPNDPFMGMNSVQKHWVKLKRQHRK